MTKENLKEELVKAARYYVNKIEMYNGIRVLLANIVFENDGYEGYFSKKKEENISEKYFIEGITEDLPSKEEIQKKLKDKQISYEERDKAIEQAKKYFDRECMLLIALVNNRIEDLDSMRKYMINQIYNLQYHYGTNIDFDTTLERLNKIKKDYENFKFF